MTHELILNYGIADSGGVCEKSIGSRHHRITCLFRNEFEIFVVSDNFTVFRINVVGERSYLVDVFFIYGIFSGTDKNSSFVEIYIGRIGVSRIRLVCAFSRVFRYSTYP